MKELFEKKQALIKEIALELKNLTQESGEDVLALLHGDSELSFGAWVVEDTEWYTTVRELAEGSEGDIEDAIADVIADIKHEVRLRF